MHFYAIIIHLFVVYNFIILYHYTQLIGSVTHHELSGKDNQCPQSQKNPNPQLTLTTEAQHNYRSA